MSTKMRAVVYDKPFSVTVREVDKPKILHPDDIIVKVTTSCICGSDLHMYEGRTAAQAGIVFGHEKYVMGIVDVRSRSSSLLDNESESFACDIGSRLWCHRESSFLLSSKESIIDPNEMQLLKKGDRVVMPFNVACGRCLNCEEGEVRVLYFGQSWILEIRLEAHTGEALSLHSRVLSINVDGSYVAMGPYPGGQAEYVRVPFADFNALTLPPGTANEEDFALLADIFPTGWHGVQLSGFRPGESVAVFGAGPVGLMAAYSAVLRGASEVYVVDRVPERLAKAKEIGCTPIDFSKGDPVEQIMGLRGGREVDRGVDAVGYQATTGDGKTEQPNAVIEALIRVVRPTGGLGIPGLYVPSDPGAPDAASAKGYISFPFGKLFEKGLTVGTGQCNVKAYNRYLRDLIIAGRAKPSFVVSHNVSLDDAADAYVKFDKRIDGYTKVLLHP
ncbi:Glutathione-independent formaldehyde dehydrogenase [Mycena sanguinolenta]|uniref:Glutathione-independent formaldehyde dehydrogenase n=1 Tax=Mycena sanguinolenta TaxID=230812 RepID=A0A8H7DCK0_9AGAR|nr:Glutathione-independent formaldehyde dehydrogenase [Mycena sanguinolenta]